MASLFQGDPQKATSYVTSTTETPKWLQDAIYNQVAVASNIAQTPWTPYSGQLVAGATPQQQQAWQAVSANQGAWQPEFQQAQTGMQSFASKGTADQLRSDQNQYLRQGLVDQNLNAGQSLWGQAGQMDITGAAQPYLNQAGQTTAEALSERALSAASPYLQAASQSSAQNVGQYMSPYQQNAMDVIAKQGARNLSENLLPSVSDAFIRAGQFGGTRMGEFGSRALRDTQESILNQQAQMANQGYGQALSASQADLARQAQLAGTVGSISGADLSRVMQGGAQYGNLAQTAGSLTGQQQQNLASLGQMQTAAGQAQQQYGLSAAQAAQAAQAADYQRQMGALSNVANMAQQGQQMRAADVTALEAAGLSQQQLAQKQADAAYQQYMLEQQYPKTQLDWLSSQISAAAPNVQKTQIQTGESTGQTYSMSPLQQFAAGLSASAGLSNLFNNSSSGSSSNSSDVLGQIKSIVGIT